jgi:hypothetical protein
VSRQLACTLQEPNGKEARGMKLLVMVSHTETWCGDGTWPHFDQVLDGLRRAWDGGTLGAERPVATFCAPAEAVEDKETVLRQLRADGHEIGVHSHLPGSHRGGHSYQGEFAYRLDDEGRLNQDLAAARLRARVEQAGLGAARTHVSGFFTFRDTTVCVLEHAGFTVDCSLMPGTVGTHPAVGDFVLWDNRARTCPATYRPSRSDHCQPGDSSIIELPVWGHLNAEEDQGCLLEIVRRSEQDGDPIASHWEGYWRERGSFQNVPSSGGQVQGKPEIVQMFFHWWDFLGEGGSVDYESLVRLGCFLRRWAEMDDCSFATASHAARWMAEDA